MHEKFEHFQKQYIPIRFHCQFVPRSPINNIAELVQITACGRPGNKNYLSQCCLVYGRKYASLGLNKLTPSWNATIESLLQCDGLCPVLFQRINFIRSMDK